MLDIFGFFGGFLGYLLLFFFNLVNNYGFAIILFTIFIKIAMFPISIKRQKSMAKSMRMSKKQQELQKRHGKDKEKLNSEMAKLYEKEGSNPLESCFPMIIPMFLLFGVYQAVINPLTNMFHIASEKVNEAIKILPSLSGFEEIPQNLAQTGIIKAFPSFQESFNMFNAGEMDLISDFSHGFNFLGLDLLSSPKGSSFESMLWIIPVLSVITSFFAAFLMQKMQKNQPQQAKGCMTATIFIMPLFSAWFSYGVPAALGFYWIILSVLGVIESVLLMRFYSPQKTHAYTEAARIALLFEQESKIKRS